MVRPKGKARAMARQRSQEQPAAEEDEEEKCLGVVKSPYAADCLEEMGAFALRAAVTNHLAAAHPDASAALLSDLRDVNLSALSLTQVAQRLVSKGKLIPMTRYGPIYIRSESNDVPSVEQLWRTHGTRIASDALQQAAAQFIEVNFDVNKMWEKYKELMEPMVGPEDLEERRAAARAFEAKMKRPIEAAAP